MKKNSHIGQGGSRSLVSVKPSGYKRPFFYIHGADGHTIDTALGRCIDPERPFYGIRAVGRDGQGVPHTCIEEMAAYYIQEIQTVQPEGPYLLGGRCTGGNIALEMAQQLKKRGQKVLLVVMVDSPKPLLTEEEKVEYPNAVAREQMRWRGKLINDDSNPSQMEIEFNPKVFEYNLQIPTNHVPQIYSGLVVYFAAQEKSKDSFISELLQPNAWNRWAINGVEVYEVPGDHLSMTKEPNVNVLAEKLSTCLDRAECDDKKIESNEVQLGSKLSIDLELEKKGYAVTDFLGEDEVQSLLKFYEENSSPKDILESILSTTIATSDLSYRQRVIQKLKKIFSPKLKVLFPNHRVLFCTFVNKKANEFDRGVELHQDPSFSDETSLQTLGIWCPLIDVNEQNGCFYTVPKSHLLNLKPRFSREFPYSQETLSLMKQDYLASVPMKAGQALIYNNRLFHGSFPNITDNERLAVICFIIPKDSPVYFYCRDSQASGLREVFEVDDTFYDTYIPGKKPENAVSLGVVDERVAPITPEQLVEFMSEPQPKVDKGTGIRERFLSFFNLLQGSDWWFFKIPPLLAIAYALDYKRIIHREIETKGYAVINFLNENEVKSLISFYKKQSVPDDMVASPGMVFSIGTTELSYRHKISQEIKKSFTSQLKTLFPNYRIAFGVLGYKKADASSSKMPLHQDCSLTDETVMKSFGVWCPLIDVDEQNGCLQVVNRSHLLNSKARPFWVFSWFPYGQEVLSLMQEHYLTSVPMKAGQALIYDKRLFHGSPPNLTANERVAAICALVPQGILSQFCSRESQISDKIELFEVEDEFYDRYIAGQKPEGVKSLGTFDYEVDPLTPEQLVEFMSEPQPKVDKGAGIRERFLSFFNLLRGSDWWFYKIPPLLAIAYAEILLQATPPQQSIATLLTLLASTFFVAAYGHVINDIFDIEVDKLAGKQNRMASLSTPQRLLLCVTLAGLGLVPWLFIGLGTQSAILLAAIYILLTIYSAPPLRLKERDIWGAIADAAAVHAIPTLFVSTVFSQLSNLPRPESVTLATVATLWAFLVGIRGIVLHQIWDLENDLASGINTLVVRIGVESARSWLSFLIFPCEMLLLGLLVFVISQFAPFLGGFFILYVILRGINTKLTSPPVFDPAPAQKASVPAHDFYEAWLPLKLLVLLSIREASFVPLLIFHIVIFYPAITRRLVEFNPLLLTGREVITNFINSIRTQSVGAENNQQLSKTEVTNETLIESPSTELKCSMAKSIDFLASSQLDDGEFRTEICQRQQTTTGELIEEWSFDSSPFATSLVLYSLSFLKHESKVKQITDKGLKFLLCEMEFNGLWRYWSSKNPKHQMIPPDLDDICCISHILRMHNISHPSNTEVIFANRNQQGMFYTWVLPRSFKTIFLNLRTLGKALSYSNELWKLTNKDDVCCAVNANALLYLGENQQTQAVIKHLIDIVFDSSEDSNTAFYNHKLSFYYMLSRAYFNGIQSLGVVKNDIINKVLNLQEADGSFGNELLTALAICTLLNFNYYTASLEGAINFLLKTQQPNGSWQRIPMYGGQLDKATFGSAELTTAICVEALARYCLLDTARNFQQSRTELQQLQAQLQQAEQEFVLSQFQLSTSQTELAQLKSNIQQTQEKSEQFQAQLQQTKQELAQYQSELQTSQAELAQLKSYLQQAQGVEGVISYYRSRIASNPDDIQLYHQVLTIKPDDGQIYLQLGNALVRQNRFDDAIASIQTALQFQPDNFEIHLELGKVLEKEQKWDDAINSYRRAIELNPDYSWSHQHLGDALAEVGQIHEASTCYRRALQLQPRIF
ncbi:MULTISPECIES: phytanoyl-CoA dioxygenase family protein [unclassified Microcoleus]|uniref:phytanoyl-CoA dioxygenase family protein n=1 Tax=unclassified Microcoleus TaxID=2642155 RepID=UPI0025F33A03|nr:MULTISPECIES: phytanoyl-CoA dioxygenase family protein [unclassified Microcoleus]